MTQREKDILHWLVRGKTNAEIVQLIGATTPEVNHAIERIFKFYNSPNRVSAVVSAIAMGDIDRDELFREFA